MKSRLIKKKIKQMNNKQLYELVAYDRRKYWLYYGEKEFDKRLDIR